MFQRAAFLGQVKLAAPFRGPLPARRLGGMLEDYNNEINALKDKLSRLQKPYMQPAPPPSLFPAAPPAPTYTPPPQPPPGTPNCFTRPDGSTYYGYPDGISTPNNLPETWCTGAGSRPLEPEPPPSITSEVDYPGTGMPPISVDAGDEVPPPVPTLQPLPGVHAPVSTGIPFGEEGRPPYSYPPEPTQEQLEDCPRDTVWAAPGDSCPEGMEKTVPGSNCCYKSVASVSPGTPSFYPPLTSFGTTPVDFTTSAQNFSSTAFGAESAVSAPSLMGRRVYPVVNRGPRRI